MTTSISEQIRSRQDFSLNTKVYYRLHTWRVILYQPSWRAEGDELKDAWYRNREIEKHLKNNETSSWKTRADRSFFIYLTKPDIINDIIDKWGDYIIEINGPLNTKHQDIMLEDLQIVTRRKLWYNKFRYKISSTRYGQPEQEIFEDMQNFCVDSLEYGSYKLNDTFRKTSKSHQKKIQLKHSRMRYAGGGGPMANWQKTIFRNPMPFTATGSIYLVNHDDVVTLHLMYKKYITKSQKVVTFDELE